ncbi:MAG: DUF3846 domain-containing protein [Oscillospiraceae bacterium]
MMKNFPPGTEIELIKSRSSYLLTSGLRGRVKAVREDGTAEMIWENGSRLALDPLRDEFRKADPPGKIRVVLLAPGKEAGLAEIEDSLDGIRKTVGGEPEEYMPYKDDVALVCCSLGKYLGLAPNRAVVTEDGRILDIVRGTFFLAYSPGSSPRYLSMPGKLSGKYMKLLRHPLSPNNSADLSITAYGKEGEASPQVFVDIV